MLIMKVYVLNFSLVEFTYNVNRVPKTTTPFFHYKIFSFPSITLWETLEIGSSDLSFVNHFLRLINILG